jgi:xanthine/CO dehydrogenase XdhC/CoxF family maturation factor
MQDIRAILEAHAALGRAPAALATIAALEGRGYRRPGARLLVTAAGTLFGAVSGVGLASELILEARAAIAAHVPRLVEIAQPDPLDPVLAVGLGCEGPLSLLIEPLDTAEGRAHLRLLRCAAAAGGPSALGTVVSVAGTVSPALGDRLLLGPSGGLYAGLSDSRFWALAGDPPPEGQAALYRVSLPGGEVGVLWERLRPEPALFVFGAGPDAPPLVALANALGWRVTVVDHRGGFARPERFPGAVRVLNARPDDVWELLAESPGAAAVVMTHHHETDRALLTPLLAANLSYVGIWGPRRRAERMLDELAAAGLRPDPAALGRLFAPAGLDLGAERPAEVALAILAEIRAATSGRSAYSLRDRPGAWPGPEWGHEWGHAPGHEPPFQPTYGAGHEPPYGRPAEPGWSQPWLQGAAPHWGERWGEGG